KGYALPFEKVVARLVRVSFRRSLSNQLLCIVVGAGFPHPRSRRQ
ncbi:MAG: hypothetical protein ACI915_003618, partial [Gammaproteobacteria bacterium]